MRITRELVDDLEMLLGSGSVQLGGDGQRRMRRIQQQQLFKEGPGELPMDVSPEVDTEVAVDAME